MPHCAFQVTPPGMTSLATETATESCVALTSEAGGGDVKESIGIGGGDCTIVVAVKTGFEGAVPEKEAVIATRPPLGTVAGAVYVI